MVDSINGHECEQTLGDSEGEGSLACCSPWARKEMDMIQQLNNNNIYEKKRLKTNDLTNHFKKLEQ